MGDILSLVVQEDQFMGRNARFVNGELDSGMNSALLIGNSDGIGLAVTEKLLEAGCPLVGLSRSPSPIRREDYRHHVQDVAAPDYPEVLARILADAGPIEVCIYFAGIGQGFELDDLAADRRVFDVNVMGLIKTAEAVIPPMVKAGRGHLIGLSSIADVLLSGDAVSYCASKAGMTGYLNGLALAMKKHGVHVTNIRFGFVDTKMADARVRPMMISREKAARLTLRCLKRRPIQFTYPKTMGLLTLLARGLICVRLWFS